MNIAIIPARSNSKRIKQKNIRNFLNYPIIYWSILAAKKSKVFDIIVVSTDDKKISKISNKYGAVTPFLRPKNISDDKSSIHDVINHAIKYFHQKKSKIDYVCCINATAPMIKVKDITHGYKMIKRKRLGYVFSATENDFNYERIFTNNKAGVRMLFPKFYNFNSQRLKKTFHDAGQFYWAHSKTWLKKNRIFSKGSSIISIPSYRSQDINTIKDWKISEIKYKTLKKYEKK